jgi:hypothetical protein
MKDKITITGVFEMEVYKLKEDGTKILLETFKKDNLVVDEGRTSTTKLIAGDGTYTGKEIDRIHFGTSSTTPTIADTYTSTFNSTTVANIAISTITYPSATSVKFAWTLDSATGNGNTIREYGLVLDNASLQKLYARVVRDAIEKDASIELTGNWTITFS